MTITIPIKSITFNSLLFLVFFILNISVNAQTSIPFKVSEQGHLMIKAKVNGVEGNFIFDTGAGMTLLTKSFADKIGKLQKLDGGYTGFRATGERIDADLYTATSLAVGNITEQHPVLTYIDVNFGPVDGLISLRTLKDQPFTIDYNHHEIILESKQTLGKLRKAGHIVPLQLEITRDKALGISAYFIVNNKLNLQFVIDSGAGNNVYRLNAKYMSPLGIDTATATKMLKPSEIDPKFKTTIFTAELKSIHAKNVSTIVCKDIKAAFIPDLIYDGIVSLNWIGKQITFDLKNAEMIVQ